MFGFSMNNKLMMNLAHSSFIIMGVNAGRKRMPEALTRKEGCPTKMRDKSMMTSKWTGTGKGERTRIDTGGTAAVTAILTVMSEGTVGTETAETETEMGNAIVTRGAMAKTDTEEEVNRIKAGAEGSDLTDWGKCEHTPTNIIF